LKLYDYYRSSAAYRVRIALNLKGLHYDTVPVNLLADEQLGAGFSALNPQGFVPALETDAGVLTQSLAIIEYLDETWPNPPLLAGDAVTRARQRAMALIVACDIHPLNNLRVLRYLKGGLELADAGVNQWIAHWISSGFAALEHAAGDAPFLGGEQPMLPDVCLVPQVFNARRYNVPLEAFPRLIAIAERCNTLEAFTRAAPDPVAGDRSH